MTKIFICRWGYYIFSSYNINKINETIHLKYERLRIMRKTNLFLEYWDFLLAKETVFFINFSQF